MYSVPGTGISIVELLKTDCYIANTAKSGEDKGGSEKTVATHDNAMPSLEV